MHSATIQTTSSSLALTPINRRNPRSATNCQVLLDSGANINACNRRWAIVLDLKTFESKTPLQVLLLGPQNTSTSHSGNTPIIDKCSHTILSIPNANLRGSTSDDKIVNPKSLTGHIGFYLFSERSTRKEHELQAIRFYHSYLKNFSHELSSLILDAGSVEKDEESMIVLGELGIQLLSVPPES
jgi:hypothetical protein